MECKYESLLIWFALLRDLHCRERIAVAVMRCVVTKHGETDKLCPFEMKLTCPGNAYGPDLATAVWIRIQAFAACRDGAKERLQGWTSRDLGRARTGADACDMASARCGPRGAHDRGSDVV